MKKFLILALGLLSASSISAEDILQVMPADIAVGYTDNDYDEDHRFAVLISNENADEFTSLQFDMYLPKGLTILNDRIDLSENRFDGEEIDGVWTPDATAEITDKGNGHYFITLHHSNNQTIHETSGEALYFYYMTATEVWNTIFPIVIKNIKLTRPDETSVEIDATTSYLICGYPEGATLAVEGILPSFVTDEVNEEAAITALDLAAATQINGELKLGDGLGITAVGEGTVVERITYQREQDEYDWGTYCLPFEIPADAAYQITSTSENAINLSPIEGETVAAGTPFFQRNGIDVTMEDVTLAAPAEVSEANILQGTYTAQTITDAGTAYLKNNSICTINGYFNIKPYRAYLTSIPSCARRLAIKFDTETGINTVNANKVETIYSITGTKLNKAQKGINIVNGNKVLVK